MSEIFVRNILDIIEAKGGKADDEGLAFAQQLIRSFSCPKNPEIEQFLHRNAIDFARKRQAITYFVLDDNDDLIAYFALTHKAVKIDGSRLSKTVRRGLDRHAERAPDGDGYNASAFLVAQFGKNAAYGRENPLTGNRLMEQAIQALRAAQHLVGGGIVYLECEDEPHLIGFYTNKANRFRSLTFFLVS
ncbi:MAG: hypothetical protein IJR93_07080 [Treponema sp.]|nr:hypothetical protein [Treponema sp.]